MANSLLYFVIALAASSIGSMLGIGGGVIIVPILISIGITKELASVSSSLTVCAMSIISSYTYFRRKQGNIKTAVIIACGSIPGSYLGVHLNSMVSPKLFNVLFAVLLSILLILMFIKDKLPKLNLGNISKIIFGIIIGILAGMFGIGGGPITVPVLLVFFALQQKEVSGTSSYITLITAFTSVVSNVVKGNNNMELAIFMIPGAIIGSQIGTFFNKRMNDKALTIAFNMLLIFLLIKQFI